MILDSVQLKTKYLELFSMINRNQSWLSAPKHSSVCSQSEGLDLSWSGGRELRQIGVVILREMGVLKDTHDKCPLFSQNGPSLLFGLSISKH